jgi:hypothetical protein
MPRSVWFRHGFLNGADHLLVRVSDAVTTLVLVWWLTTERFSHLALAQAVVAPLLMFFVAPESVIYRDFARWKADGREGLAARLGAFRKFGWLKWVVALGLSAAISGVAEDPAARFATLAWAFTLALAPQLPGGDREFLRMELRFGALIGLTVWQKASLLGGTAAVALAYDGRPDALAAVAAFSAVSSALATWVCARRALAAVESRAGTAVPGFAETIGGSLRSFSLWSHLSGVFQTWVQTMDLFFLGFVGVSAPTGAFSLPARELGLYATALKLANFSTALPFAVSNLFSVWVGRRLPEARETTELKRVTAVIALAAAAQALVLAWLAPWLVSLLSHGRWSSDEQARIVSWLGWMLAGMAIFCSTFPLSAWLSVRGNISALFARAYLPWTALSAAIYAYGAASGGPNATAVANVWVALALAGALGFFLAGTRVTKLAEAGS